MILIRINAVYGWSRKIVVLTIILFSAETIVGLVTTILSLLGGSSGLMDSTNILTCQPNEVNLPDVNVAMWCTSMLIACIYLGLVLQKASEIIQVVDCADGQPSTRSIRFIDAVFRSSQVTPTLHLCLRDAGLYFVVIFGALLCNLILVVQHNRYAQLGTPWLLATYSVASTRIFLNLKDMSLERQLYIDTSWTEIQKNSELEFQVQSALRASNEVQSAWRTSADGPATLAASELPQPLAVPPPFRKEIWEHIAPQEYPP